MTTKDFNETLDSFKFKSDGPMLFGQDDKELLKTMAKEEIDHTNLLFAVRFLVVAKYLDEGKNMNTRDFNETLDQCKVHHKGPILAGCNDSKLLRNMAKLAIDADDLLFAIRFLIAAKYLKENQ